MSNSAENNPKIIEEQVASTPTQAGSIKIGGYCVIEGFPCQVVEYNAIIPAKKGSPRTTIIGTDIFTNKKYQITCPMSAIVMVPNIVTN